MQGSRPIPGAESEVVIGSWKQGWMQNTQSLERHLTEQQSLGSFEQEHRSLRKILSGATVSRDSLSGATVSG